MIRRRVEVRKKLFVLGNVWVWEVSFVGIRWGSFLTWEEAMKSANEKARMLATNELKARVRDSIIQQGMLRCSVNE